MRRNRIVASAMVMMAVPIATPTMAHTPWEAEAAGDRFWGVLTVALLLGIGAAYASGIRRLWRRSTHARPRMHWRAWAFAGGWSAASLALLSPLDEWSEMLFVAHMIQHEILMLIAAPLLVVSRPTIVLLWALPRGARRATGRLVASRTWRGLWRPLSHPVTAWTAYACVLWLWHAPPLFEAALREDGMHALQHASFLGAALLFWSAFLEPHGTRRREGVAVLANFTTAIHASILAAAFTFSQTAWYAPYLETAHHWRLTALQDQQLGGLVMWIPGGVVHVLAAVVALAPRLAGDAGSVSAMAQEGRR